MPKSITYGLYGLSFISLFYLISFPLNEWFSMTMLRHQILQLPAMLLLGIGAGILSKQHMSNTTWGITILLVAQGSLLFWMLPRSIDLTIVYPMFNRIMHLHMLGIGFLIIITLPYIIIEVKMAFLLMIAAMLITMGASLQVFSIVLCSSFTLDQQKETGFYWFYIGIGVFIFSIAWLIRLLGQAKKNNDNNHFKNKIQFGKKTHI